MRRPELDDALVAITVVVIVTFCLWFRFLPMVDLPQHYAMVSILANHGDPSFGFQERYTFDFVGRPYATVYLLGALLAKLMPLTAALRIMVAICTVAPMVGLWALLGATNRPRIYALLAVPFAFGSIWHWGFLNYLLGTGMFLALLALVVHAARHPSWSLHLMLGALALLLLVTHVHGLFMLLGLAPVFAWAYRDERTTILGALRTVLPLAPAVLLSGLFVLLTWQRAGGKWVSDYPAASERIWSFPEFLGAGLPDPWPVGSIVVLAGVACLVILLSGASGETPPGRWRQHGAFTFALASQVVFYFALPLNTGTAAFVSARHALLVVLLALPLLPALTGRRRWVSTISCTLVALSALIVVWTYLGRFDREARDFDRIIPRMKPNRRVASLVFDRHGTVVHPRSFPYHHFAAYYQAARGGDLAWSFARLWNVPIRYRASYRRHALDDRTEFAPQQFSLDKDLPHYDYLLVRSRRSRPEFPAGLGLTLVVQQGAWSVWANTRAVTP